MTAADDLLRRYLRQRGELGEHEIVLDRLTPADFERILLGPRSGDAGAAAPAFSPDAPAMAASAIASAAGDTGSDASGAVADAPRARSGSAAREAAGRAAAPPAPPADATRTVIPIAPGAFDSVGLDELRGLALACVGCDLCQRRETVVFGEGDVDARVMVVGEAPGPEEDRTGRPFVGPAGRLLDRFLAAVGIPRESVYLSNALMCRPPGARKATDEEVAACRAFLQRQVELVDPDVILAVGTLPAQTLLGSTEPIGTLRGRVHEVGGRPLIPTYDPGAVLRNPALIRPAWDDLQRLRDALANT